jgi:hypothetical protein
MMKNDLKGQTRYGFTPTAFPLELFHWFPKKGEADETGSLLYPSSKSTKCWRANHG